MNDASESLPHPLLPRRLMAIVYDTFLVLPLIMALVFLAMAARTFIFGEQPGDSGDVVLGVNFVQAIEVLSIIAFFSAFWIKSGQTLGMQAWRIKLVSIDGGPVRLRHCIARCFAAALSAACLGIGYWWCLFDRNQRYWHDYLSGTELVLLPKREKQ